jgi:hypothetical protein
MILRLFFFMLLCIVALIAPTAVLALCALAYALKYTAYELILLAAAIDAYYGLGFTLVPYYTIVTCVSLLLIEWIKPRISVYNQ